METLENNQAENVHVIHKSLTILLFKGLVAWIIVAFIYMIGGVFISGSNTVSGTNAAALQTVSSFWSSIIV